MLNENSGNIGIVGLAGSGKTTYLSMLPRVISPPWYVNYNGNTQKLIREASTVLSRGEYPNQTDSSKLEEYKFTIKKEPERLFFKNRSAIEMTVTISDLAGEHFDFESPFRMQERELFDEYLYECQGILFLIDPLHQWVRDVEENINRYVFLFHDILNSLNNRNKDDDFFIAFCITKFDVFLNEPEIFLRCIPNIGNQQLSLNHQQVQDNLAKCADLKIFMDSGNTIYEIEKFGSRPKNHYQWFACSATGWIEFEKEDFTTLPENYKDQYDSIY